mmetsp:Transcript_30092/g.33350  ORF Transcript_30092/g.33350 Transcript_30092/m.33350 type:complete len:201 (-) Transcript_30092:224-826(-)
MVGIVLPILMAPTEAYPDKMSSRKVYEENVYGKFMARTTESARNGGNTSPPSIATAAARPMMADTTTSTSPIPIVSEMPYHRRRLIPKRLRNAKWRVDGWIKTLPTLCSKNNCGSVKNPAPFSCRPSSSTLPSFVVQSNLPRYSRPFARDSDGDRNHKSVPTALNVPTNTNAYAAAATVVVRTTTMEQQPTYRSQSLSYP